MNLITRTHNDENDFTDVRKSQRVPKTPSFLKEYVIAADYEDNTLSCTQHPDLNNGVDTTENHDVQIIFDKLFSLVEQWQQELFESMEKVDHDDYAFLSILNKYVTDNGNNDVIEETSTCRLSIGVKRESPEPDEIHSVPMYWDGIINLNYVDIDRYKDHQK